MDKQDLERFAQARRALRLACSSIDCVHDDGSSIWNPTELIRHALSVTVALNTIVDIAERVADPATLLHTGETVDEALDGFAAELLEKL